VRVYGPVLAELVPLHGIAPSGARPNAEEIRKSAGNSVQIRCRCAEQRTVQEGSFWAAAPAIPVSLYQIPGVPKWSLSVTADYDWEPTDRWHAHLGAVLRWIDQEWERQPMLHTVPICEAYRSDLNTVTGNQKIWQRDREILRAACCRRLRRSPPPTFAGD
jgi:hypothetical protein